MGEGSNEWLSHSMKLQVTDRKKAKINIIQGNRQIEFGLTSYTVFGVKIRSNIFRAIFWSQGLAQVILDTAYLVRIPN